MANAKILISGELSIEQNNSRFWRMRWKDSAGGWQTKSTKKEKRSEAEQYARDELAKFKVLKEHGIDVTKRRISEALDVYCVNLDRQIANATKRTTHHNYLAIANTYIRPIAGQWKFNEITNSKLQDYYHEVGRMLGRVPAKGTFNQHNIVWRSLFQIARDKKWCSKDDEPTFSIKGIGSNGKRRSGLTLKDYIRFRRFLRTYAESKLVVNSKGKRFERTPKDITTFKRQILKDYCIVLLATGMRPGDEPLNLKWKHIKHDSPISPVEVVITAGKTAKKHQRTAVAWRCIIPAFRRIRILTKRTDKEDLVFCTPDGKQLKDMSRMVSNALLACGLKLDDVDRNRAAYSLRHTYATFNILYRHFTFEELKENMGTSVLMIEKHYSHVKSTDIRERLASGKLKPQASDRKIDKIHSLLMNKFTDEVRQFITEQATGDELRELLFAMAADIEITNWNKQAKTPAERAEGDNLRYLIEPIDNRVRKFLEGESEW